MSEQFENKEFTQADFESDRFKEGIYEDCHFSGCQLIEWDLSGSSFIECTFENCDLSMVKLNETAFRDVTFSNCRMQGVDFSRCKQFLLQMTFENCQLNLASFYQLKLVKTKFTDCSLREADFTEGDFSSSWFEECDLDRAIFHRTLLDKADLSSAMNFMIDPDLNSIQGAKFSRDNLAGLVMKYGIVIK
ncbi:MAG: pentapeptide repeat-containing protein [Calditrichaeota bacterium]|nr:pentapeptide repeat-containing protein [Calditrichota bacterium]